MAGEMGEACNVIKKIRRLETGAVGNTDAETLVMLTEQLGFELADTFTYLDLTATKAGIDLPRAIIEKFNTVSIKNNFPQRI